MWKYRVTAVSFCRRSGFVGVWREGGIITTDMIIKHANIPRLFHLKIQGNGSILFQVFHPLEGVQVTELKGHGENWCDHY